MNEHPANNGNQTRTPSPGGFRPKFTLYHANAKGTGSALKLELHPAHDDVDGSIFLTLACQKTVGDMRAPSPTCSTFDWENAMCVKLDFSDLTQMLQVFRGETESIADEKGIFHRMSGFSTNIRFRHVLEPRSGYAFELYRNYSGRPDADRSGYFFFRPEEALGVSVAIENSLGVICFGIPKVVPHETSAIRRNGREQRDVSAA